MHDHRSTLSAPLRRRRLVALLRTRLILTVGLLVGCFVLSSAIGLFGTVNQQQLGEQKVTLHNDINILLQSMIDQETGLRGYIVTNNPTFLAPLDSGRTEYTTALQRLKTETSTTDFHTTAAALAEVEARTNTWLNTFEVPQIAAMQAGQISQARSDPVNARGKTLFDTFRQSVTTLQQAADNDLGNLQMRVNTFDIAAIVGSLLLAVIAVIALWRTFRRFVVTQREQLEILSETAEAFGAGDLSVRVEGVTDADLREVGQTFNTMAARLQEQQSALRDRDILEQVSQLNNILTGSLDLTELMQEFLGHVLTLLDIQVGALYLYEPQDSQLNLFTTRGLHPESIQTSFMLGEGLVGRAAQERAPLMITRQQHNDAKTFQVKTLLGVVLPSSLYHLPLLRGNELLGVLVIGSIYPMREQARNVLRVVASNVASAISNTQAFGHIQDQARELSERAHEQEQANLALRQQRDELTALNAALEEANQARSQFLSRMSHELRTPLTSIIGFSQILLRPSTKAPLNDRQTNNIERILKNAQHLLVLINDVLDLSKVEAGRMDINVSEVNLREMLNSVVDESRSIAAERGLNVQVTIPDEIATIETDPMKLRQIVLNLLSNALKFTEHGKVTISATRRTTTPGDGPGEMEAEQVAIAVKDTGIGIALDKQEHIFDAFYQVDNSSSRIYGGTGLGLSIVREFTLLLGGKIEIESRPGEGTTFTVLLPRHRSDRQSMQDIHLNTIHGQPLQQQRVLSMRHLLGTETPEQEPDAEENAYLVVAIDDNPDVLQLITSSLEQSPYRVVGIQDATQAVAKVQELQPHVVTLDIMMPKINGWQILHQLKSNPATAAIPVILLTVLEDRSAGYVLGADEYLVKPVARDALLRTLRQFTLIRPVSITNASTQQSSTVSPASSQDREVQQDNGHTREFKHILLVHKEPNVYDLIERLVNETGYHIKTAEGDQEVMEIIEKAPPDLLMLFVRLEERGLLTNLSNLIIESEPPPRPSQPLERDEDKHAT